MQRDTTSHDAAAEALFDDTATDSASTTAESALEPTTETTPGPQNPAPATAASNTPATARGGNSASTRTRTTKATPAKAPADPKMTTGDELEIRLARMHFWKGAFTRRGVNLERHFHPEPLVVTDLDLFAIDVTSQLTFTKTIGEAKSGTGKNAPKPLDRAIWIAGLKQLVGASSGVLVTASKPSVRIRETVSSLGVTAFSIDELDRWEATHLPQALADVGSHGPGAFTADNVARTMAKGEPSLERIYWFLRSEVWFLDSWQATKRLIGALAELRKYWTPEIDDGQAAALRWMYSEALSILVLHLVALVGIYQTSDIRNWPELVKDRLAAGAIPTRNQLALADAFDNYLAHVLGELKAPSTVQVEAIGAFHPTPPDWADALIELLSRLESFPGLREVPRQTDLVMSERLVRRRHADAQALAAVTTRDPEEFARVRRQIAAFLRGCVELPDAVDKALTA